MVTRSIENYEQHKKDIHKIVCRKFGKKKADKFIRLYSDRYDKFGRSFIDYRLALNLMEDVKHVNKIGTRVFAAVGVGGTGKSTLLKNILYWLDGEFKSQYCSMDVLSFIKNLKELPTTKSMRAVMLDEPETEIYATSKTGGKLRKITGKWRQQSLFVGFCATDLTDIPPYLFKKVEVLFFLPYWGVCYMVRNKPRLKSYPVQKIRMSYMQGSKGYNVFYELKKKRTKGFYQFKTMSKAPMDEIEGKEYDKKKAEDYESDITSILEVLDVKEKPKLGKRDKLIVNWWQKGKTNKEIAELLGVDVRQSQKITKRLRTQGFIT